MRREKLDESQTRANANYLFLLRNNRHSINELLVHKKLLDKLRSTFAKRFIKQMCVPLNRICNHEKLQNVPKRYVIVDLQIR